MNLRFLVGLSLGSYIHDCLIVNSAPELAGRIMERMESDRGKLFIGGISWDTNEDRLRGYFKNFGEVVEAVIMKDRTTGRARGFGFVVFADPAVADRVVMEKHQIDGRMVEAKKAVPRDDHHILNRNNSSIQASPGLGRTKKIFVGGLASSVTDADFKKYFEQFGTITDVIVMYDHNTQRPRGFGFITFDSEDAVDKVLHKIFHELNGKMVEVKRAVPKELSPGPNLRLPIGEYNHGINRINNFLNGYNQGYNPTSMGSYGIRMDGRFGPLTGGRKAIPSLTPGYGIGMNFEPGMNQIYGGSSNVNGSVGYGRSLNQFFGGNSSRFGNPIGYRGGSGNPGSTFSSAAHNLWENGDVNYGTNSAGSNSFLNSGSGSIAGFSNGGLNWSGFSSPLAAHGVSDSTFTSATMNYAAGKNNFGLVGGSYGRGSGTGSANSSFVAPINGFEGNYSDSYDGSSIHGDPNWQTAPKLGGYSPFGYGLGSAASDVTFKGGSIDYMGGYNVSNRQTNRGKRFLQVTGNLERFSVIEYYVFALDRLRQSLLPHRSTFILY
ncbi:Heterogeneous nuclear ribonucleoprotein 1 [Dendrobium catenatum]|uniref:Heterogeneous nuclear ribonucleoprotein 1 n=1 Tax=Dendrobium catenatum TaxID=906689 RepID=A0A2I0XIL4_9ASPA|nr:Heterogeneous nuclear ribonucleoprotein 1 [Dendrobium catenatum]